MGTLFIKYATVDQARQAFDIATLNNHSTFRPLIYTVCLLPLYAVHCLTYYAVRPPPHVSHMLCYTLSVLLTYFQTLFTYCPSPLLQTVHPPLQTLRSPLYILSFSPFYILSIHPLAYVNYILRLSAPPKVYTKVVCSP